MSIYMLSQHPHILHRLREEIRERVGMGRPSYDDIKGMKFLRAFINGQSRPRRIFIFALLWLEGVLMFCVLFRGVEALSTRVSDFSARCLMWRRLLTGNMHICMYARPVNSRYAPFLGRTLQSTQICMC